MARYKLRVPVAGTWLYGDGPEAVVADTIDEAREMFLAERDDPAIYLHSSIGRCRVVYARDVESGDCHEDAEPGDTTIDYLPDTGRDLKAGEVRVWQLGWQGPSWEMAPATPLPIAWQDIPVGAGAQHAVLGWGEVCAPLRLWRASGCPVVPVLFDSGERRDLFLGQISLFHTVTFGGAFPAPPPRYRVTVAGELVVENAERWTAEGLLDARLTRLRNEWEAEQYAAWERAVADRVSA